MNSHLNSTASLLRGIPLRSIPRRRERRVSPRLDWMLQVPAIYQRELDLHTNHLITLTTVTDVLV